MKKLKYLVILLICIPTFVSALEYPKTNSKIVEIYDMTDNKVLYEIDSRSKVSIASLTKIATTITAIENIENLDEKVTITGEILSTVRWDASRAGLYEGETITYKDLLYASMLPSGADATNALAILSSGSIEKFVDKMNNLAKKIGLDNTHFINVTGLDIEGHYSSAENMRKLLSYALENDMFKEIYTTRKYTLSDGLKVESTINTYNRNSNIDTSKIKGSKTGFTEDAGYCLSTLSTINGHDFIIIVLNAEHRNNIYYNIYDTVNLIDFIGNNYKEENLLKKDELLKTIPVSLSDINNYQIYSTSEINKYLPSDYNKDDFVIEYDGLDELSYKNKKGETIGKIKYYYKDELLLEENVILNADINLDISKYLKAHIITITISLLSIIILIILLLTINKKRHLNKMSH